MGTGRRGRVRAHGGIALSDLALTNPSGTTAWLLALGLTALTWWVVYRLFHYWTNLEEAPASETDAADISGPEVIEGSHPHLAYDDDESEAPAPDPEWFGVFERDLAEAAAADTLEIAVTACARSLRDRLGALGAAAWVSRRLERGSRVRERDRAGAGLPSDRSPASGRQFLLGSKLSSSLPGAARWERESSSAFRISRPSRIVPRTSPPKRHRSSFSDWERALRRVESRSPGLRPWPSDRDALAK